MTAARLIRHEYGYVITAPAGHYAEGYAGYFAIHCQARCRLLCQLRCWLLILVITLLIIGHTLYYAIDCYATLVTLLLP